MHGFPDFVVKIYAINKAREGGIKGIVPNRTPVIQSHDDQSNENLGKQIYTSDKIFHPMMIANKLRLRKSQLSESINITRKC